MIRALSGMSGLLISMPVVELVRPPNYLTSSPASLSASLSCAWNAAGSPSSLLWFNQMEKPGCLLSYAFRAALCRLERARGANVSCALVHLLTMGAIAARQPETTAVRVQPLPPANAATTPLVTEMANANLSTNFANDTKQFLQAVSSDSGTELVNTEPLDAEGRSAPPELAQGQPVLAVKGSGDGAQRYHGKTEAQIEQAKCPST